MRLGFVLPGGSARLQLDLAVAADANGWDGVFVWEVAYGVDAPGRSGWESFRSTLRQWSGS
ncbi:MAG: hypothetical protein ACR2H3_06145 [Acidimicrobiales bacterium]